MKQSKKVVARIIILILALFTVIPGTVSQKVYAEPGGSESNQAADASKDDSNKKEEKKEEDMTPEEREEARIQLMEKWLGGKVNRERVERKRAERKAAEKGKGVLHSMQIPGRRKQSEAGRSCRDVQIRSDRRR